MTEWQLLLRPPNPFVDRELIMDELDQQVIVAIQAGQPARLALYGLPGVGVRSVARQWYWRTPGRFADGAIPVNLGGVDRHDSHGLGEELGGLLVRLGVPPGELPTSLADRQSTLLAKTFALNILLVLEGVTSPAQIEPFLLNSPGSAVLALCRTKLSMLWGIGFRPLEVRPLDDDFGVELFDGILPDRSWRQVDGISPESVVKSCGGYPRALTTTAAQLAAAPSWRLSGLVRELSRIGISALDREFQDFVVASVERSYQELSDGDRRAYRLVAGLHPGSPVTGEVAAVLLGQSVERTRLALARVAELQLIDHVGSDLFELRDFTSWHARQRAELEESRSQQLASVGRVVTWYLDAAVRRDRALSDRPRIGGCYRALDESGVVLPTRAEALDWLEEHRATLVAAVLLAERYQLDELSWQLCEALWGVCHLHGHFGDWITTHRVGLASAARIEDQTAVARMSSQLGAGLLAYGDLAEAEQCFGEVLRLATELGDGSGVQSALEWRAKIEARRGRHAEALELLDRSWRVTESEVPPALRPRTFAMLRLQRARVYYADGRYAEALAELGPAIDYFAEGGEADNLAKTLGLRAYALADGERDGDWRLEAPRCAVRAAELFRSDDSLRGEAWAHELLRRLGHPGSAARLREIYTVLGDPRIADLD
jgi:tetratricopeptide (TPR) repeat protein